MKKAGKYEKGIWMPTEDKPLEKYSKEQLLKEREELWKRQYMLKKQVLSYGHKISEIDELLFGYKKLKEKLDAEAALEEV